MPDTLVSAIVFATALGAVAVGGALGVFSVMVMPALRRLPASQAVSVKQRINQVALTPIFLGAFLGTAIGSAIVALHAVATWGGPRTAEHIAAQQAWTAFAGRWILANHVRSVAAGALLVGR